MFWGRREEKLRGKRRKILAEGNYIFCRGEEKRRRKRRKIFGVGKSLFGRRRVKRRRRKIPGIGRYSIGPTII